MVKSELNQVGRLYKPLANPCKMDEDTYRFILKSGDTKVSTVTRLDPHLSSSSNIEDYTLAKALARRMIKYNVTKPKLVSIRKNIHIPPGTSAAKFAG